MRIHTAKWKHTRNTGRGNNQRLIYSGRLKFQHANWSDESGTPVAFTRYREGTWDRESTGLSADKRSAMQGSIAALQARMVDGHARDGYGWFVRDCSRPAACTYTTGLAIGESHLCLLLCLSAFLVRLCSSINRSSRRRSNLPSKYFSKSVAKVETIPWSLLAATFLASVRGKFSGKKNASARSPESAAWNFSRFRVEPAKSSNQLVTPRTVLFPCFSKVEKINAGWTCWSSGSERLAATVFA